MNNIGLFTAFLRKILAQIGCKSWLLCFDTACFSQDPLCMQKWFTVQGLKLPNIFSNLGPWYFYKKTTFVSFCFSNIFTHQILIEANIFKGPNILCPLTEFQGNWPRGLPYYSLVAVRLLLFQISCLQCNKEFVQVLPMHGLPAQLGFFDIKNTVGRVATAV